MSYHFPQLGEIEVVGGSSFLVESDRVYLWRGFITGITLNVPTDTIPIVQAVGGMMKRASSGAFDIRGICVQQGSLSGNNGYVVDIVLTSKEGGWSPPCVFDYCISDTTDADAIAQNIKAFVSDRWPSIEIPNREFDEIIGPSGAKDFWLSHAIIYDESIGPTQALQDYEGIYKGNSDKTTALEKWKTTSPGLEPGGSSSSEDTNNELGPAKKAAIGTFLWVAAAAALIYFAPKIFGKEEKR